MRCPYCGFPDSKVIDSRPKDEKIKRRRECNNCGSRFTTYEIMEKPLLMVEKRSGSYEVFNRNKLGHLLDPDPDRLHGIPAGRSRRDAGHQYFGMPRRRSMRRPLFTDLGYNDHVLGRRCVQPHQPCQHTAALCDHIRGCFSSRIPRRRHPGLHHQRTGSHDRDAGHTGPYDPCDHCDQKEWSGGYQQDESVTAH